MARDINLKDLPNPGEVKNTSHNQHDVPTQQQAYTPPSNSNVVTGRMTPRADGYGADHKFNTAVPRAEKLATYLNAHVKSLDPTLSVHAITKSEYIFGRQEDTVAFFKKNSIHREEFKKTHGVLSTVEYALLLICKTEGDTTTVAPLQLHSEALKNRVSFMTAEGWVRNIAMEQEKLSRTGITAPVANIPANHLPHQTINSHLYDIIYMHLAENTNIVTMYSTSVLGIPSYITDKIDMEQLDKLPEVLMTNIYIAIDSVNALLDKKVKGIYGQSVLSYKNYAIDAQVETRTTVAENIFSQTTLSDGKVITYKTPTNRDSSIEYNYGVTHDRQAMIICDLLAVPTLIKTRINNVDIIRVRPDIAISNLRSGKGSSGTDVLLNIYMVSQALQDKRRVLEIHGGKPEMGTTRDMGILNNFCGIKDEDGNIIDIRVNDGSLSREDSLTLLSLLTTVPAGMEITQVGGYVEKPETFQKPSLIIAIRESDSNAQLMNAFLKLVDNDPIGGANEIMNYLVAMSHGHPTNVTDGPFNLGKDQIITGHPIVGPVGYAEEHNGEIVDLASVSAVSILHKEGHSQDAWDWAFAEASGSVDMMDIKMRILNSLYPRNVVVFDRIVYIHLHPTFISLINNTINVLIGKGLNLTPPMVNQSGIDTGDYSFSNPVSAMGTGIPELSRPISHSHKGNVSPNGYVNMNTGGVVYR